VLLPHDPVREATLDREALLALHPRIERREHLGGRPDDDARCDDARDARESRHRSGLLGYRHPCALLGERLTHMVGREPDLFRDVEEALLGDVVAGVELTRLELCRAREHTLER
jgi:hypothetical protein